MMLADVEGFKIRPLSIYQSEDIKIVYYGSQFTWVT